VPSGIYCSIICSHMSNWLTPPYYTVPPPAPEYFMDGAFVNVRFSVDYGMGLAIDGDLKDPNNKFNNSPSLDPQYHDPIAYAKYLVEFAETLKGNNKYYAPSGWDPVASGLQYANEVFGLLQKIPCNRGDEQSNNLFDSWAAGTGQNYGGHPAAAGSTSGGTHPETAAHPAAPGESVSIVGNPQE
jgi:hypothetical protein